MATKPYRVAVVLSILVLVGAAGAGTYWIVKKGLTREKNAQDNAERFFRERRFDRAAELAREILVSEPNRKVTQELLLESLIQGKQFEQAREVAETYAAKGKDFARIALCRLAIERHDVAEAERIARALTDAKPAFAHTVLAILGDSRGIASNNWQLRLRAANTMRGLAAIADDEATRANALIFSAQIILEIAPFINGSERLVEGAREDLKSAVTSISKAYQIDHAYPRDLNLGIVRTLSTDEAVAEVGAGTLREHVSGVARSEEVIATLALYHLRRNEVQESIDLINDISDSYLWSRVFWVLRHGGHREVALRVLEEGIDSDTTLKRMARADILFGGESAADKQTALDLLTAVINDPQTQTAEVLRALVLLGLRADLETARSVAESANLAGRNDTRITALLAFLMNTNESDKARAIEIAKALAGDINTVTESRDMLYLLGGGTDVMNSYLDAQVAKGGESGLQHRLTRALNNMGLARRESGDARGKHLAKVVTDIEAVLADKEATKAGLLGAFSIASAVGETDLAGRVLARALALSGAPELLAVRVLQSAFRTADQNVVKKFSDGVRAGAKDSHAPAFVSVFAELMLTRGEISKEQLDSLDEAARTGGRSKAASLDLACRIAILRNDMGRAESYARALLEPGGNSGSGRALLGAVLTRAKSYDKVMDLYEGVDPLPQQGYYQCVGALWELGRREDAFKLARKARSKFPRSHQAYVVLSRLHMDAGEVKKALAVLNVAPSSTFIAMMKGELLVRLEDFHMAEQQYEAILAQTGFTNPVAWSGLYDVLSKQDRRHDFIRITDQILAGKVLPKDAPIRATIHLLRGQTLERQGKVKESLADYEMAIALNPRGWAALNNAAWHITQLTPSRIETARKYIEAALKIKPNDPALLDTAAEVYAVQGRYDAALKQIDSCLMIVAGERAGEYQLHKSQILIRADREAEARELLAKIRADYADTPLARKAKGIVWKLDLKNMPAEEEDDDEVDAGKTDGEG